MHLREARPDELLSVSELTALAFEHYPLFEGIARGERNERGVDKAMLAMQRAETGLFMRYQVCLVGTREDGEIIAAALIESPYKKATTRWQYLRCGGLPFITKVGIAKLRRFVSLAGETTRFIEKHYPNSWYVDTLAVDPRLQGQRLGSQMINEGIVPFIAERGGGILTLTTNTEINAAFYLQNGFTQADVSHITRKDISLQNWTFVREIASATYPASLA